VNLLVGQPSVPLTNAGGNALATAANAACQRAVARGSVAPGTWNGQTILNLSAGATLPNGYLVQFANYNLLTETQRLARTAQPLLVSVILTDAAQSVAIGLWIQA
jgi:hypothetical protein